MPWDGNLQLRKACNYCEMVNALQTIGFKQVENMGTLPVLRLPLLRLGEALPAVQCHFRAVFVKCLSENMSLRFNTFETLLGRYMLSANQGSDQRSSQITC